MEQNECKEVVVGDCKSKQLESVFFSNEAFTLVQRKAKLFSESNLVPESFRGPKSIPNIVIAIEMAYRMGMPPLMLMQNLYIVHGKPCWSSTFIIASINATGKFYSPLNFRMEGEGNDRSCVAYAHGRQNEIYESPPVTIQMAIEEGWMAKAGSKWKTMSELMLRYRAATMFGRLYAPEALMGIRPVDELEDIEANEEKRRTQE